MKFKSLRTRITVWTVAAMLIIPVTAGMVIMLKQFELASSISKTMDESDNVFKATIIRDIQHAMMVNQLDGVREELKRVSAFKGIRGVFLVNANGTPVISYGPESLPRLDGMQLAKLLKEGKDFVAFSRDASGNSERLLALPILNKPQCMVCHTTPGVNGALLIRQASVDVDSETRFLVSIMLIALLVASIGAVITLLTLLSRNVIDPIKEISNATQRVGQCDLNVKVPVSGDDEVGELARSFNQMIADLRRSRDEVEYRSIKCEQAYLSMKEAQKKLIQSEKLAAIGTLVAGIAHEINNPVGIIAARTDCMLMEAKEGEISSQLRDDLMVINRQTGRIADITRSLLTFARQAPAELVPVDVNDTIRNTVFLVAKQFYKEGMTIETHLSPKRPRVLANANRLQQVLLDLLNNSRDAMPGGGTIILATANSADKVEITLADTGEGIPEDVLDNIFDPFFTTKEVGKGTGLGLSVSYGIIQDFGGTIEVRSRVGEGSTFNIMLPRLKERQLG